MSSTSPSTPSTRFAKSSISKPQKRVKTYLTIDDLHRMYAGKSRRTCLPIIRNRTFSRSSSSSLSSFSSHMRLKSIVKSTTQMRITFYFKSAREMSEKTIFSSLKCDLIPRSSRREMRINKVFKCAPNLTAQRCVSGLLLINVKRFSEKTSLSSHTWSLSLYCHFKRSSSRLRCMPN